MANNFLVVLEQIMSKLLLIEEEYKYRIRLWFLYSFLAEAFTFGQNTYFRIQF